MTHDSIHHSSATLIVIILVSLSLMVGLPLQATAVETVYITPEGLMFEKYAYDYQDRVNIEGYNGTGSNVEIPSEINGKPVKAIKPFAFSNNSTIEQINIPSSVTVIGSWAFDSCSRLKSITIPSSVTDLGSYLFQDCTSLVSATLGEGITGTTDYMFDGCSLLTSVTLPSTLSSIGFGSFRDCSLLKAISIPNNVTSIGKYAFYNCSLLSSISLPAGLNSIGESAFNGCSMLNNISLPQSLSSIGQSAFRECSMLGSITVPGNIGMLAQSAFWGCSSLSSVVIENGVQGIGQYAFYQCKSLSSLSLPTSLLTIADDAFIYCESLLEVTIPDSVLSIGGDAFATINSWQGDKNAIIKGYTGSAAQRYAEEHGNTFIALDEQKVTSVTLDPASAKLETGKTQQLTATVLPENATNKDLAWSSSDPDVGTVDATGLVTTVAPGIATIIATAQDGSEVSGSAEITVNKMKYDMSGAAWDYTGAFTHDGTEKTVALTGLPAGLTPSYTGNTATEAGIYSASVTFTYDTVNYEAPIMPDLTWVIEPAVVPVLKGDATNDGTVDILDLVSIIDYIVSNTSPASQANADANGDGTVDILDLVWIIDQIVGG